MLNVIQTYLTQSLLAVITVLLLTTLYYRYQYNQSEELRSGVESALSFQSALIDSNRIDYESNLDEAKSKNETVRTQYVTKIKYIEKGLDANPTYSDAINFIDSYNF